MLEKMNIFESNESKSSDKYLQPRLNPIVIQVFISMMFTRWKGADSVQWALHFVNSGPESLVDPINISI